MQLALRRGYGYSFDPFRGMRGLGDDTLDPSGFTDAPTGIVTGSDPIATGDPLLTDESGNNCLASMFVNGQCPQSADPSILFGMGPTPNTTPGPVLTPAQLAQQQASASAWLLQNVPVTPSGLTQAQQLATLGLTAAQIASGLTAGTVRTVPTSSCASGYQYSAGPCVPGSGLLGTPLIAGVSNTTLAIGAVIFLALMMMGGKRR
jgi:hypothetical protein